MKSGERGNMKASSSHPRILLHICITVIASFLTACSSVGPSSIANGRGAYTEAIATTNDRQILTYIVGIRYTQSPALLGVTSITANMNVVANASSQFGIGPERNWVGNIIPLSVGFAYEENPTISYTPIQGEKFMRQLLSPIPLDLTVLLHSSAHSIGEMMTMLVRRINSIWNPDFLRAPSSQPDPNFTRVSKLFDELWAAGSLELVRMENESRQFALALFDYSPSHIDQVRELSSLLSLPDLKTPNADLLIPLQSSIEGRGLDGLALQTRSVHDLMRIAAASIDVPEEHRTSGAADEYPPLGPVGDYIRIHHSEQIPSNASVAIKYRGWWFYIDETDQPSKRFFRLVEMLTGARIADIGHKQQLAPLLTIPASR
jgi:hypothetical protein